MTKNEIVAVLAQVLVQNQRVKGFNTRCPDLLSKRRLQLRLGPEHRWTPRNLGISVASRSSTGGTSGLMLRRTWLDERRNDVCQL